jgi:hypothetical protein
MTCRPLARSTAEAIDLRQSVRKFQNLPVAPTSRLTREFRCGVMREGYQYPSPTLPYVREQPQARGDHVLLDGSAPAIREIRRKGDLASSVS